MPASAAPRPEPGSGRLISIDALRGFAMFWLIGGRELALALVARLQPQWLDAWEIQLTHPKWGGPVAWDLVMPVFLFVVGVSLPFALAGRGGEPSSRRDTYRRIGRRVLLLWALGILLQAIKPDSTGLELYSNALQAIAVGYLVAAAALLHLRLRGQISLLLLLVLGYGALLLLVPFAGHPAGTLERRLNLPHFIDEFVLGPFRHDHSFAWLLPSLGFSSTVLMGAMAGRLLRAQLASAPRIVLLLAVGAACITAGWAWSHWLPMRRQLWTSSLVLWSGGIGFCLMALFHTVIDIGRMRRWAFPLVVIGSNALLAYVADSAALAAYQKTIAPLVEKKFACCAEIGVPLLECTGLWLLLWFLYRKKIFFRA